MGHRYLKFYVRVYYKKTASEVWQTLGPYDMDVAINLMNNYLKLGMCSWIENVEIAE